MPRRRGAFGDVRTVAQNHVIFAVKIDTPAKNQYGKQHFAEGPSLLQKSSQTIKCSPGTVVDASPAAAAVTMTHERATLNHQGSHRHKYTYRPRFTTTVGFCDATAFGEYAWIVNQDLILTTKGRGPKTTRSRSDRMIRTYSKSMNEPATGYRIRTCRRTCSMGLHDMRI